MNGKDDFYNLIGKTPLICADNYALAKGVFNSKIYAKLEFYNPTGSVKDRAAIRMIEEKERLGLLKKGGVIIEPTSGNLGISISAICAKKGYNAVMVMPKSVSSERVKIIKAYGAKVVLTPSKLGMVGAIEEAEKLLMKIDGAISLRQFSATANVIAHYETTGREIWECLGENVDFLVAGVGTGGTISGAGKFLKEKKRTLKIVAVEPYNSPFLSCGKARKHGLQGIGAGFLPPILDLKIIDEIIQVREKEAFYEAEVFAKTEGFLVGISAGAALFAAKEVCLRPENKGKTAVVILPDGGLKYLSEKGFFNSQI